ncbi:MAG TPA: hypothetical protein PLN69_03275 [bacterium]|nr:hypothetical protein [bacterium]
MVRRYIRTAGLVIIGISVFFAGCSQKNDVKPIPGGMDLPPEKIVERLFSAFAFNDTEGVEKYFATDVPEDVVTDFIGEFISSRKVGKFKALPINVADDKAEVTIHYNFNQIDSETGKFDKKKQVEKRDFSLVKQEGYWKIRTTGFESFDSEVESHLFKNCLSAALDVSLAQERYRQVVTQSSTDGSIPAYTNMLAPLQEYADFNERACESISIEKADDSDYLIKAVTMNLTPCEIYVNREGYAPESYEECAQ